MPTETDDKGSDRPELNEAYVGYLRTVETQKTIRRLGTGVLIVAGLAIVCYTIVRVTDQPPWLTLILGLVPPLPVFWVLLRTFRKYMENTNTRIKKLEESIDPERSSSGLNKDGTTPND